MDSNVDDIINTTLVRRVIHQIIPNPLDNPGGGVSSKMSHQFSMFGKNNQYINNPIINIELVTKVAIFSILLTIFIISSFVNSHSL